MAQEDKLFEWPRVLSGFPGDELYTITEPYDGKTLLDVMEQRRWAFWNSRPEHEKTHYQGYSAISQEQLINSLKRQTHAELAAVHAPHFSFMVCPWMDTKLELARQMNEEGRHFNLIRDHLRELGGDVEDGFAPDFPEWNQLFSLFLSLDNRFFLDPAKEVIARCTVLNFGLEGWDHLYVQPLFIRLIEDVDPTLHQIYDEVVMPDETFHYSIGQRALEYHCDRPDLQRVAAYFLDRQLVAHAAVNAAFPRYHQTHEFPDEH